ncbi:GNAT family N-acetyltransferase [Streptomyces sp. NPDC055157]
MAVLMSSLMRARIETPRTRLANRDDLVLLPGIQLAAGDAFRDIGMADVADSPPPSVEEFAAYQRAGRAWVVTGTADETPRGFVIIDLVDGCAHIEQVSIHPSVAGHGLGGRLLDHVTFWAAERSLLAMTLITFRAVPWNAPYYRRLGFQEMDATQVTPGLRTLLNAEIEFGLDPAARVCMRRPLTPTFTV